MTSWHNETGRPLSSLSWLKAHHNAKLDERKKFAHSIINNKKNGIKKIVDLGCGPGLWLDIFNDIVSSDCEFVGLDSDQNAIFEAKTTASKWKRPTKFLVCDIINQLGDIPEADIYLAFNIFPYLESPENLIFSLKSKLKPNGILVVRQYDGATMRFGPMIHENRLEIDGALFNSVGGSRQFCHYDLDRVYQLLEHSKFESKNIEFELFFRKYPYSDEFLEYYKNTMEWTMAYVSESAADKLQCWADTHLHSSSHFSYFSEIDLTAVLS